MTALLVTLAILACIAAYGLIGVAVAVRWHAVEWRQYYKDRDRYDHVAHATPARGYVRDDGPSKPDNDFATMVGVVWPIGIFFAIGYVMILKRNEKMRQDYEFSRERNKLIEAAHKELNQ